MLISTIAQAAQRIMERADALARHSEEPDRLTRRFATPAMGAVMALVGEWMRAAEMSVRRDNVGNLIGRYEAARPGARTLLLGSHLDTVRDAGKYDGPLGVLVALAAVERLAARGARLPFAVEVVAFADEEGLRYQTAYLGSKALVGALEPHYLALTDDDGVALAEALRAAGGDPTALAEDRRAGEDLLGYCEVHIEQGPVLETEELPVGVVSAIAGQSRVRVRFTGMAGHAGTVPPALRRDALCAAAEFVLAVESVAHGTPDLVATVGQLAVAPGASNVICGQTTLSLDVRHPDDATREQACRDLQAAAGRISATRQVALDWQMMQEHGAVPCDPRLTGLLGQAVAAQGVSVRVLPSGAGHDAVVLAGLTRVAMLFVRCRGGISHHPAESVMVEDVAVALAVLERFLTLLGGTPATAERAPG